MMTEALSPQPGRGTRLTLNSTGYLLSASPARASFRHPWRASLAGNKLQINLGLVEFREPTIDGKPMSALGNFVKLDRSKKNKAGESFVCVEAHPNKAGQLDLKAPLTIVQTDDPLFYTPTIARFPLVMVLWKGTIATQMEQIAFWNPRYYQTSDSRGVRHFFL